MHVSRCCDLFQVALGTGYGQDYARPDICDYHPQKTAVFLMAIGRLEELCEDLVRRSFPRDCPVAIVENASTPRQRSVPQSSDWNGGCFHCCLDHDRRIFEDVYIEIRV